jgi:chitodextrinase
MSQFLKRMNSGLFLMIFSIVILFPTLTFAAVTRVSGQNVGKSTSGASTTLAFPAQVTSGNTVIVMSSAYQGSGSISVTKSSGTATVGTPVKDKEYTNGSFTLAIWRIPVTGTGTLTVSTSRTGGNFIFLAMNEYAGVDSNPVDVIDQKTATSNTESTNALTTTAPGVIVMLSTENSTKNFTYTQSDVNVFKDSTGSSDFTAEAQDKITSGAGANTLTAATANSWQWYSVAVAYKAGSTLPDTQAPSVPTNLSAAAVSTSGINLSWSASTDNVGVVGYKVFRGGVQIATTTTTSYANTGLNANTTYSYTVSAYDAAQNVSAQSSASSATTFNPNTPPVISFFNSNPNPITSGQSSTLSWSVASATSLFIDNGIGDVTGLLMKIVNPIISTIYTLTASNSYGSITAQTQITVGGDITSPSTPTNLSAAAVSTSGINLSWSASTDNVGVVGYKVFRGGVQIATTTTTSYANTGLNANTTYSYTVSAYDAAQNVSAQSSASSATTFPINNINGSYTTTFSATENPIYENGSWINGGMTGLDWADVRTTPGFAFGVNLPSTFADPTAVLTGTWSPDQEAHATVRVSRTPGSCCHEVELRLRSVVNAHSITGYEILCSVVPGDPYLQIVRWNGALNNFTYVNDLNTSCGNGDVLKASIVGNTITVYKNGNQILQGVDSTFTTGNPGIGFYDNQDTNWSDFGFSDFSASNIVNQDTVPPSAPTNLVITTSYPQSTTISWNASTDNVALLGYKVYRNGIQVATTTTTSYTDTGFPNSTSYTYNIAAVDTSYNVSSLSSRQFSLIWTVAP